MSSFFALAISKFTKNVAIDGTHYSNELHGYDMNHTTRKGPILSMHSNSNSALPSMNGNSDSVH